MVMLQMAEKSTKLKRRALLMQQAEPPTTTSVTPPQAEQGPQPLVGDAFDRMRMDPEIQAFRRRLLFGAVAVGVLVLVLLAWKIYDSAAEEEMRKKIFGSEQASLGNPVSPNGEGDAKQTAVPMTPPEDLQPSVTAGNLVFRPPGKGELKTATALPLRQDATANLAKLAAAEDVLGKFLQASDWTQRVLLVRNKLRAAPLMSIYYAKNADAPLAYDSFVEAREISSQFSEHVVVFEGGGRRLATVEHTVAGPRVDWESFVGAGEMAWSDFLETKPAVPSLFRVLVSPAGHFENQFGNPAVLNCYSLRNISEPGAKVVYGYVDKAAPLAKELDYWLQKSEDATVPMVLRLKYPPDAAVDFQVCIHQFVQAGWVLQ